MLSKNYILYLRSEIRGSIYFVEIWDNIFDKISTVFLLKIKYQLFFFFWRNKISTVECWWLGNYNAVLRVGFFSWMKMYMFYFRTKFSAWKLLWQFPVEALFLFIFLENYVMWQIFLIKMMWQISCRECVLLFLCLIMNGRVCLALSGYLILLEKDRKEREVWLVRQIIYIHTQKSYIVRAEANCWLMHASNAKTMWWIMFNLL